MILKDLSFKVKPCEKIGVVGRTGAGKSTISISLSRIVELLSGSIFIDGVDISDLNLEEIRKRITVIPQVNFYYFNRYRTQQCLQGL